MNNKLLATIGISALTVSSLIISAPAKAFTLFGSGTCSTSQLTTSFACDGAIEGNDQENNNNGGNTAVNNVFDSGQGLFGVTNWMQLARPDSGQSDNGLTISDPGTTGSWSYNNTFSNYGTVMAVLKGGTEFSAFLLNKNFTAGTWDTSSLENNGGQIPDLSHFTLYTSTNVITPPPTDVPEPLTILGTGLALGFGGLFKKQQGKIKSSKA